MAGNLDGFGQPARPALEPHQLDGVPLPDRLDHPPEQHPRGQLHIGRGGQGPPDHHQGANIAPAVEAADRPEMRQLHARTVEPLGGFLLQ